MELTQYQNLAATTAIYPDEHALEYVTLGLVGEAGEIANKVKKTIRDDDSELTYAKMHELADELGDVLWYVAMMAQELGFSLDEIALKNLCKLDDRMKRHALRGDGDKR